MALTKNRQTPLCKITSGYLTQKCITWKWTHKYVTCFSDLTNAILIINGYACRCVIYNVYNSCCQHSRRSSYERGQPNDVRSAFERGPPSDVSLRKSWHSCGVRTSLQIQVSRRIASHTRRTRKCISVVWIERRFRFSFLADSTDALQRIRRQTLERPSGGPGPHRQPTGAPFTMVQLERISWIWRHDVISCPAFSCACAQVCRLFTSGINGFAEVIATSGLPAPTSVRPGSNPPSWSSTPVLHRRSTDTKICPVRRWQHGNLHNILRLPPMILDCCNVLLHCSNYVADRTSVHRIHNMTVLHV